MIGAVADVVNREGNTPVGCARAGQILHQTLDQGNDEDGRQAARNPEVRSETWAEMCAALLITPQCLPFN